jgi:ABC-2 type transport system permease protein
MTTLTTTQAAESLRVTPAKRSAVHRTFNLTRELAVTQFKLKYTGSILGYLWSLLKPLMIFAIMYVVFVHLLHINSGAHGALQLLVAIVIWTFFAEAVGTSVNVIVANTSLIKKAYFPRTILVIAASLTALMTFLINITLVIAIAAPLHQIDLSLRSLVVVPLFLELYVIILGAALLLSSLFVFYRDLGHIWEVSSQLLFYASAVVYPLTPVFLQGKEKILGLNPLAQIIEDVRHALVTATVPWTGEMLGPMIAVPFGIIAALVVAGYVTFTRLAPRFAEQL